ncbi:MAG: hypothetical protein Q9186_004529 [Xanthomendoza sp. 1 TL-2023]
MFLRQAAFERDSVGESPGASSAPETSTLPPEIEVGHDQASTTVFKVSTFCPSTSTFQPSASFTPFRQIAPETIRPTAHASSRAEADKFSRRAFGLGVGIPVVFLVLGGFSWLFWVWIRRGQPKLRKKVQGRHAITAQSSGANNRAATSTRTRTVSNVAHAGTDVELGQLASRSSDRDGRPAVM